MSKDMMGVRSPEGMKQDWTGRRYMNGAGENSDFECGQADIPETMKVVDLIGHTWRWGTDGYKADPCGHENCQACK